MVPFRFNQCGTGFLSPYDNIISSFLLSIYDEELCITDLTRQSETSLRVTNEFSLFSFSIFFACVGYHVLHFPFNDFHSF